MLGSRCELLGAAWMLARFSRSSSIDAIPGFAFVFRRMRSSDVRR